MQFWPATDRAQLDYERLRRLALAEAVLAGTEAECFRRGGLAALIHRPTTSSPRLVAKLVAVPRPRWSPYADPRLEALADAYAMLTGASADHGLRLEAAE